MFEIISMLLEEGYYILSLIYSQEKFNAFLINEDNEVFIITEEEELTSTETKTFISDEELEACARNYSRLEQKLKDYPDKIIEIEMNADICAFKSIFGSFIFKYDSFILKEGEDNIYEQK